MNLDIQTYVKNALPTTALFWLELPLLTLAVINGIKEARSFSSSNA